MLPAAALAGACSSIGAGPAIDRTVICAGWRPILVSPADGLTEETAREIEAHNLYGERIGCWTRPGGNDGGGRR